MAEKLETIADEVDEDVASVDTTRFAVLVAGPEGCGGFEPIGA